MTLGEAAARGISTLRKPYWAPGNYLTIDLSGGCHGPWGHLHYPDVPGPGIQPSPRAVSILSDADSDWEPAEKGG